MVDATQPQFLAMKVSTVAHIKSNSFLCGGKEICSGPNILRTAYNTLKLDYPKFFKMDKLSQLGILGVESVYRANNLQEYGDDRIALLFNNRDSSLDPDVQHHELMQQGTPSPAVFVYTLPNIVLGEIAIKYKWYGEQLCTVSNGITDVNLSQQCSTLFKMDKADAIIILNINAVKEDFEARFALVEKSDKEDQTKELEQIFI